VDPSGTELELPWEQAGWRESVARWVDKTLLELSIGHTGEVEHLRERPWAALAVVPTAEGDAYFKASAPTLAFEPSLTLELARQRPDCIPAVLGIDIDRGWMLMREAGTQLRELLADTNDPQIWDELLPLYAELQIELAESAHDLLELGTPDKRPAALPAAYEDLVSRWSPGREETPPVSEIEMLVEQLGDTVPVSVVHEEVQDNNIFVRDGRPVFIDWGEASIAHPFTGLVVTMRGLVDRWEFEPGGPEVLRFRDLYLEPWTRFAPLPALRTLFTHAYALGTVSRAHTHDRLISPLGDAVRAEYAHIVPAWLDVFVETLEGRATLGT
jgi:hypothetical protein